jgi:[ribosomal protein S5]-alanine N-acetyltransferase
MTSGFTPFTLPCERVRLRFLGKGLMQEALPSVLDYAFDVLDMHRIAADVDPRNAASSRLLERLGFRHEGRLRERWFVNGEVCDSEYHGLLRHEWLARRSVT